MAAFTWDEQGRRGRVYVDGATVFDDDYKGDAGFAPIEQSCRMGQNFIGALDEIRLYSRVLTGEDILALK